MSLGNIVQMAHLTKLCDRLRFTSIRCINKQHFQVLELIEIVKFYVLYTIRSVYLILSYLASFFDFQCFLFNDQMDPILETHVCSGP